MDLSLRVNIKAILTNIEKNLRDRAPLNQSHNFKKLIICNMITKYSIQPIVSLTILAIIRKQ